MQDGGRKSSASPQVLLPKISQIGGTHDAGLVAQLSSHNRSLDVDMRQELLAHPTDTAAYLADLRQKHLG